MLGKGWQHSFLFRYDNKLYTAKRTRLDKNRSKQGVYTNFNMMYSKMYLNLDEAGIAEVYQKLKIYDGDSNIVENQPLIVGLL